MSRAPCFDTESQGRAEQIREQIQGIEGGAEYDACERDVPEAEHVNEVEVLRTLQAKGDDRRCDERLMDPKREHCSRGGVDEDHGEHIAKKGANERITYPERDGDEHGEEHEAREQVSWAKPEHG